MSTATSIIKKKSKKAKPQHFQDKIRITSENYEEILDKFVTGEFQECLAEADEMQKVTPSRCPTCRSAAGYERMSVQEGPMFTARRMKEDGHYQQNRRIWAQCIDCGTKYRALELWHVWVEFVPE